MTEAEGIRLNVSYDDDEEGGFAPGDSRAFREPERVSRQKQRKCQGVLKTSRKRMRMQVQAQEQGQEQEREQE